MLLSNITVIAAGEVPAKNTNDPTWHDVFALQEYVGTNCYDLVDKDSWMNVDDVSNYLPYYKQGTLLASATKEQAYSACVDDGFSEEDCKGKGEDDSLSNDAIAKYGSLYDAGIALVNSVKTATGEKYTDDISPQLNSFWEEKDKLLWQKVDTGQIIAVSFENEAPDTASMEQGTYWVLESDLDTYGDITSEASSTCESWENLWSSGLDGMPDISRSEMQNVLNTVTSAYNTLLGKLHEGTKSSKEPVSSLTAANTDSQAEEPQDPVIVNEVTFSNGAKSQSSLDGVYGNTFVAGAIYNDDQTQIKQAAGLTEEEIKSGVVVKYYICNSLNKTMNEKLSQAVSAQGYRILGVMKNDLYRLNKGDISLIKSTSETLTVILGVPSHLKSDSYEFVVFCYDENGNLTALKDIDTDKSTITVQAKSFGYWAIGYQKKQ